MKRALIIGCTMVFTAATAMAQDFVSKYMQENKQDTVLHCISVSPKMMEEVLKIDSQKGDEEEMRNIMANLKSMQIVSSKTNGDFYFNKAEEIIEKNANRFEPFLSFNDRNENCRIMVRKKEKTIIELVMFSHKEDSFQVINFTGNMNDEFIDNLVKTMMPRKGDKD